MDRAGCCWRCGEGGHITRECSAERDVAAAFKAMLSRQTGESGQLHMIPDPESSNIEPAGVKVKIGGSPPLTGSSDRAQ